MGQCFQDIGLTEWTNVVAKQCPNEMHRTKENFNECIRDSLKAVAGFLNVGDQLIRGLCTAKKPAFMPMHEFMQHQVQLFSYLNGGYIHQMMELSTAQEKSKKSSLRSPRWISTSLQKQTRQCPWTHFGSSPFLSSVRLPIKRMAFLTRSRRKISRKRRRWLIFLSLASVI